MNTPINRQKFSDIPEWSPLFGKQFAVKTRHPKNRAATEKRIYDTLTIIARRGGIGSLKINKLAREAEVSKELIYRYFGGLDKLIELYARKTAQTLDSASANTIPACSTFAELRDAIKRLYRIRSELYYKNPDLRIIGRRHIDDMRHQGEAGLPIQRPTAAVLKAALAVIPGLSHDEIDVFDGIITAAHAGLMRYMDNAPAFNNIDLNMYEERERIHRMIDCFIDCWLEPYINKMEVGNAAC